MSRNYFDDLGDRLADIDGIGIEYGVGDEAHPSGMRTGELAALLYFGGGALAFRDYFEDAIVEMETKQTRLFARVVKAVTKGDSPMRALTAMSEVAEDAMRRSMERYNQEPNKPSTIKRKGFNDPLRHYGNLISAVQAVVVEDAGGDAEDADTP